LNDREYFIFKEYDRGKRIGILYPIHLGVSFFTFSPILYRIKDISVYDLNFIFVSFMYDKKVMIFKICRASHDRVVRNFIKDSSNLYLAVYSFSHKNHNEQRLYFLTRFSCHYKGTKSSMIKFIGVAPNHKSAPSVLMVKCI